MQETRSEILNQWFSRWKEMIKKSISRILETRLSARMSGKRYKHGKRDKQIWRNVIHRDVLFHVEVSTRFQRVSEVIKHVNEINKLIDGYVTDKNKTRTLELKFRDDKTFYLLIFLGKGEKKSQITIQTVVY